MADRNGLLLNFHLFFANPSGMDVGRLDAKVIHYGENPVFNSSVDGLLDTGLVLGYLRDMLVWVRSLLDELCSSFE